MKLLLAFALGAIAGIAGIVAAFAIAAAVDQQQRDPTLPNVEPGEDEIGELIEFRTIYGRGPHLVDPA